MATLMLAAQTTAESVRLVWKARVPVEDGWINLSSDADSVLWLEEIPRFRLWKSVDQGGSWQNIAVPTEISGPRESVFSSGMSSDLIWLCASECFVTRTKFIFWRLVDHPFRRGDGELVTLFASDGGRHLVASGGLFEKAEPGEEVPKTAGTLDGRILRGALFESNDGGKQWSRVTLPRLYPNRIALLPRASTGCDAVVADGTELLVRRNSDWIHARFPEPSFYETEQRISAVHCLNSDQIRVSTDKGALFRSVDSGQSWETLIEYQRAERQSDIRYFTKLIFTSTKIGYALDNAGNLSMTQDEGRNWTVLKPPDASGRNNVKQIAKTANEQMLAIAGQTIYSLEVLR